MLHVAAAGGEGLLVGKADLALPEREHGLVGAREQGHVHAGLRQLHEAEGRARGAAIPATRYPHWMFDLDPGEELALLVETTRSFAAEALTPALREAEQARGVDAGVQATFDEIGLAGLELPEAAGGAALGSLARALVNEELGAADAGAALALDRIGPALYPLAELGGDEAVEAWLAPLLAGDGRAVLVDERDAHLALTGERLDGEVPWVPADRVELLVVQGAAGAVVVREGIAVESLRGAGLRAAGASALRLEGAPIAARFEGAAGGARARARTRIHTASLLLGVLRAACDFSRAYALEREAFGRPIAHHQALAFLITDMQMALDGARLLVHDAAWRLDAGLLGEGEAASAFAETIEASRLIGPSGVQILGGHGFMADYPVEKFMREARALAQTCGGIDAARDDAGAALCATGGAVQLSHGEA